MRVKRCTARRSARLVAWLGLLCSPAALAAADPGPLPGSVLAALPFLGDEVNRIHVDLAPAGSSRRFRMLVDTGANFSVLTPGAARDLGVKVRRTKRDPYRRKTLLGRDLQFYIDSRSSDTASRTGWEYGLLGGNFLSLYVVEIDFAGRRLRFLDHEKFEIPESVDAPDEAVLPLRIVSNRPGVKVEINGVEHTVLLDTGAPFPLILSGANAERSSIGSRPVPGFATASVKGEMETELGEADFVRIGPFSFESVPIVVAPKGWFNQGFPGDSVLGYDLLAQYRVRIDYRRGRIWLKRIPEARVTWLGQEWTGVKRVGISLLPLPDSRGFQIGMILPDSVALRRGLRPGDVFESARTRSELMDAVERGDPLEIVRSLDGSPQIVEIPAMKLQSGEAAESTGRAR